MDNVCRICLKGGLLSSIFVDNYSVSLRDMIQYCSNVKICENDGLPEKICSNCVYKLGVAYHFKHLCESSDIRLREYHGLQTVSRTNDIGIMTDSPDSLAKDCCTLKRIGNDRVKKTHDVAVMTDPFIPHTTLIKNRIHTGEEPYVCMYCPRAFSQRRNLIMHVRTHTGDKPFECKVCSRKFALQSTLHTHLKIHRGQKDHECSLCDKSFISSSDLTRHMKKHTGVQNFKCDECKAAYVHNRDLKLHKMKKHPNKSQNSLQNEVSNNSNHIDIIGLSDGREIHLKYDKDVRTHDSHTIVVKNEPSNSFLDSN